MRKSDRYNYRPDLFQNLSWDTVYITWGGIGIDGKPRLTFVGKCDDRTATDRFGSGTRFETFLSVSKII